MARLRNKNRRSLSLSAVCVLCSCPCPAAPTGCPPAATVLSAAATARRVTPYPAYPGTSYSSVIAVRSGQLLMATVHQRGIDLILQLYGPGGQLIVAEDAGNEDWGPERVVHVAEQSGAHELRICAANLSATPGKYQLNIRAPRTPTSRDRALIAAHKSFAEVRRLARTTDTAERLRVAAAAETVITEYKNLHDSLGIADSCLLAASLYRFSGNYDKALGFYLNALPVSRMFGGSQREARTLATIGAMYKFLGEPRRAAEYLQRSLVCCRDQPNTRDTATTLTSLAAVQEELGNLKEALDLLNQALPLRQANKDIAGEGTTLHNIAAIYGLTGQSSKALETYNRALRCRRLARDVSGEAQTIHNIGITLSALGEHEKAISELAAALQLWRSLSDVRNESNGLYGLARAERARGDLHAALARIEAALLLIEVYRDRMMRLDLKASFAGSVHKYYEFCIDVLMTLHQQEPGAGYDKRAFETSERARARSLLDVLATAGKSAHQEGKADLRKEQIRLQSELAVVARQHTSETHAPFTPDKIDALIASYRKVEAELLAGDGQFSPAIPSSASDIQETLHDDDTLLLEYSLGATRSFVWAVSRQSVASYILPDRNSIEQAARTLHSQISRLDAGRAETAGLRHDADVDVLANILLRPVRKELASVSKVIVLADGALHYVPFGMLSIPESAATEPKRVPLISAHEVTYTPSGSALLRLRQAHPISELSPQQIAIFADPVFRPDDPRVARSRQLQQVSAVPSLPAGIGRTRSQLISRLPFSRREADEILGMFPPDVSMRAVGFNASRRAVLDRDLQPYSILHFATHGVIESTHPELSGIVLSMVDEQGHPQDGFLTMADINGLRLSATLVVLSACETALGKEVRGEGLIGLTQAFMHAGAANVLASLWKVDDVATAELMKRFYNLLVTVRLRPADALRMAQLEMQQTRRWAAPYYWAGFVLQGSAQ